MVHYMSELVFREGWLRLKMLFLRLNLMGSNYYKGKWGIWNERDICEVCF